MAGHQDILDHRDNLRGPFLGAAALHAALFGSLAISAWIGRGEAFGAPDAGGASIGIQAVDSIPLQHHGATNPVANDTQSEVPQQPAKPEERVKEEVIPPDAVRLKTRDAKKKTAEVASVRQKFRPLSELVPNQVFSKEAPQVSSPLYAQMPGAGRVGTGANTTLGTRFAGYAAQIQQLVAQKWKTGDVDPSVRTANTVIATFDLMRDGSTQNIRILQRSGVSALDYSVERAILEASPFPPIPPGYDHNSAKVEFWFELKR